MLKSYENNKIYSDNMQMKKVIINADDFGYSKENNEAIKLGYKSELITSCSMLTNMNGFDQAKNEILPQINDIDLGFHFNIVEGKSITKSPLLCDNKGYFNNNYLQLIKKSKYSKFLIDIENEFRAQIERILPFHNISHIDSHMHVHAIPEIFNITVKLAKEYKIKYIRSQKEIPYFVISKSLCIKFPINIIKNILLNYYTSINIKTLINTDSYTNDYLIGILYTGMMNRDTILNGLRSINTENSLTEIIFHPTTNKFKKNNYREFLITQNPNLKKEIENLGFVFTKYYEN